MSSPHCHFRILAIAVLGLAHSAASIHAVLSTIGLSSVRAQAFYNESIGQFPAAPQDRFSWALAAGDFNGDGAMDLAAGMPFDDGPFDAIRTDAGAVVIRWGVRGAGLSGSTTLLSLYGSGHSEAYAGDQFGYSLAAGNFNGDARCNVDSFCRPVDDLAVGIPGYGWVGGADTDAGAVQVHYGGEGGIQLAGEHFFHRTDPSDPAFPDPPGNYDEIGHSLAAGDFDADGYADLAIGAPAVDHVPWMPSPSGGAVIVLHGGVGGLRPIVGYVIHQDDPPVPDDAEDPDDFGWAVAAGNFNGDFRIVDGVARPFDDLAIAAPGEDGIGAVMVMRGSEFGLIFADSAYLGQGDLGDLGEADDRFGSTLAVGNFNGDYRCLGIYCVAFEDLAIGTPFEDLGSANERVNAGQVTVLYGAASDFFVWAATDTLAQGTIQGSTAFEASEDRFGFALAAGDFDGDGDDDLAVGQPGEESGGADRGGAMLLAGSPGTGIGSAFRILSAGFEGVPPAAANGSDMGRALAAGDFDGNGYMDLAIGLPFRDQNPLADIGAVTVVYGALFADGFESGNRAYWESNVP